MPDFLNYLQEQSALLTDQLKAARSRMQRTGLSPEQTLLELQLLSEDQVYTHLATFHGLPLCDLHRQQPTAVALAKVPGRLSTRFQCVPISLHHGTLLLAFTHVPPQTIRQSLP